MWQLLVLYKISPTTLWTVQLDLKLVFVFYLYVWLFIYRQINPNISLHLQRLIFSKPVSWSTNYFVDFFIQPMDRVDITYVNIYWLFSLTDWKVSQNALCYGMPLLQKSSIHFCFRKAVGDKNQVTTKMFMIWEKNQQEKISLWYLYVFFYVNTLPVRRKPCWKSINLLMIFCCNTHDH